MPNLLRSLQNSYYIMRHGQSVPNVQGLIVSWPTHGLRSMHGLTATGRKQAKDAAVSSQLPADTIIYSSDFARAAQTAEIVQMALGCKLVQFAPELRERNFGELELGTSDAYQAVWQADAAGHDYGHGVEPMQAVARRVQQLIQRLELVHRQRKILLVSHGDTLQAAQALFARIKPNLHQQVSHLANAEIRQLQLRLS